MANLEHIEVVKQGTEAIREWREKNPGVTLDLRASGILGARPEVDLSGAQLASANLTGADMAGVYLARAYLAGVNLRGADLRWANLSGADLSGADLRGANLREADLRVADLRGVRGAHHARGLETTRVDREEDARYFETCHRPWPERLVDWERLRVVGRLPLFGISYTTLILIPIVFYGLALYNDKIELVRAWAEQAATVPDYLLHRFALLALERLHPRPIPSQSLLLLGSTVLLAIASTLYTFFSPSRIKEFSRDQWCDQLGRSLLHYWPLAWKHRYLRLACAACYALGGAGALWVLITKAGRTGLFIWHNSTWSWW